MIALELASDENGLCGVCRVENQSEVDRKVIGGEMKNRIR